MIRGTGKSITSFDSKDEARFVVFNLGAEKFGARIEQIKEVLTIDHITPIPMAPNYVLGVINLRGVVCTVIDLTRRLIVRQDRKVPAAEIDNRTVVIVEIGKSILGMAVDSVESITSVPFDIIETQLDMVKKEIHAPFLEGIAKISEDDLIILLKLDVVFSEYEVEELVDLAERKTDRDFSLDDEFVVSKEDLERLDLAHDDIDEITSESKKGEAKKSEKTKGKPSKSLKDKKAEEKPAKEEKKSSGLPKTELEKLSKDELNKLASDAGIKDPTAKKKSELVELITKSTGKK
ncbi:MAG: chemotaxis protein CheW [Candidatus Hodarchaeota archaeon]